MTAPAWRVEFDRSAVRDLRKLGVDAAGTRPAGRWNFRPAAEISEQ